MDKLASIAIRTIEFFMELLAKLGLVPRWHMLLFLKLGLPMGKGAGIPIGAFSILLKGFA